MILCGSGGSEFVRRWAFVHVRAYDGELDDYDGLDEEGGVSLYYDAISLSRCSCRVVSPYVGWTSLGGICFLFYVFTSLLGDE